MRRRLRTTLLVSVLVAASAFHARGAFAQPTSSDDQQQLGVGRQLFAEALVDEEAHRYAEALEKYKRVLKIRDTVAIRYRIGTTCEGLHDIVQAVDAYTAAVRVGGGTATGTDAAVVKASQARIDALTPKIAHLTLQWKPGPSLQEGGTGPALGAPEIRVDDEPVATDALADVRVNPGGHVITATSKGARPFRAQVSLSEGGRAEIPILLEPAPETKPPLSPSPDSSSSPMMRTIGIVTGIAGGALVVGGVIVLALRSSAISTLNEDCPAGNCPASREQELRDTRDRAVVQGPLGAVLLVTGALAIGTGIVLYALGGSEPPKSARAAVLRIGPTPVLSPSMSGAMMTFSKRF